MQTTAQCLPLPPLKNGATYIKNVIYADSDENPIDLTGYTAKMQFRQTVLSSGPALIDLSTLAGSIVIGGTNGQITFTISASVTQGLTPGMTLYYDLFIYSPTNVVTPVISGTVQILGSTIQ